MAAAPARPTICNHPVPAERKRDQKGREEQDIEDNDMPLFGDDASYYITREVGVEMLIKVAEEEEWRQRQGCYKYPREDVRACHTRNVPDEKNYVNDDSK